MQVLGERLVELSRERLSTIDMPEDLRLAIDQAQRITAHEGRRRQLQFVGRLMRRLDDDDAARIRADLDAFDAPSRDEARRLRAIEQWRARLLDDDDALTAWAGEHRDTDLQTLRTLIRQARKEHAEHKPPRAFREIFQLLKAAFDRSGVGERGGEPS